MKNLKLLSKIALAFVNLNDFNTQMITVLETVGKQLDASRGFIFVDTGNVTNTNDIFEWCNEGIISQIDFLRYLGNTISWKELLQQEKKIYAENINELPEGLTGVLGNRGTKSLIVYPLYINKVIKGFIGFTAEYKTGRHWQDTEIEMLSTISGIIANVYERKVFQDEIIASENNFRAFFETINDLFIVSDLEGKILYVNQAVHDKLGYSLTDLQNMRILDLHPPEKRDEASEIFEAMINGERNNCPLELNDSNGNLIPTETRVWMGKWNSQDCIFGICKDLSKEQEALQKFTKLFENNPAPMAISSIEERKFTDVNTSFLKKTGYSKDEIIGKTSTELELFVDMDKQLVMAQELNNKGTIKDVELLVRAKDGSILHGLFSGEIVDYQGKKSFLTVMMDITEQVALTKKVKDQHQRLVNIIEGTRLGTWEWNIQTGETIFNQRWAEMIGYNLEELQPINIAGLRSLVHPEDLARADELLHKHLTGEIEDYAAEIRLRHKSGTWVWVLNQGKVIERDAAGQPQKMFGTYSDINLRRQAEENLRESEIRYTLALEGAQAGLWDWDMISNTAYYSPLWKTMLGYQAEEVENTFAGWSNLWHPEDRPKILDAINNYLNGQTDNYEIIHRLHHKNGDYRWILTRGSTIKNQDGQLIRWVGTNMDITAEQEQAQELERFFSVNLDLLCIANTDGYFLKTNRAWSDILGYSPDELENRKFLDFIHPDDIAATLDAMSSLENGNQVIQFVNRYRSKDGTYRHIEWRSHPYGKLIYAAARDITERIENENKIWQMSIRDPLTNIYNRRYLMERAEEILAESVRTGKQFSVVMLDIDHFKLVNDTYGHQAGDFILKEFARIIELEIRPYDLLGRYGGEEFIVVLLNTDSQQSYTIINRILNYVRQETFVYEDQGIKFTFSAGISDVKELQGKTFAIDTIINMADDRLYQAKNSGRNKVVTRTED